MNGQKRYIKRNTTQSQMSFCEWNNEYLLKSIDKTSQSVPYK